jgi:hypothetical protein
MPTAPKNLFTSLFKAGETVPDTEFDRFERFLPRLPGEPDKQYAARLEDKGLAFILTSEGMRNIPEFKATRDAARDAGVPLAFLSAPMPDPIAERLQERAAKSPHDYLREARDAQAYRR